MNLLKAPREMSLPEAGVATPAGRLRRNSETSC